MHDSKPLWPMAVQDTWQPAGNKLVEADSQRSGVRLLAQAYGELLGLHLADVDADTNLILRTVQCHVDMEEPPNTTTARFSGDG